MKRFFKIFAYLLLSLLLLLTVLVVTVSFSQNKIADVALEKMSESLDAQIDVDQVSLTLIKKFPYVTLEFSGMRLRAGANDKQTQTGGLNDVDIVKVGHAFVSLKARPLLDGNVEIIKIEIEDASINYLIDSLGCSNLDFLMDTSNVSSASDSGASTLPLIDLQKFSLKNSTISYVDEEGKMTARIHIPEMNVKGLFSGEDISFATDGELRLSHCSVDSTNLSLMNEAVFKMKLKYQLDTVIIEDLDIRSDGAHLNVQGKTTFLNDLYADLKVSSEGLNAGELIKYAPNDLLNEYGIKKVEGLLNFDGRIKGIVSDSVLPRVDLSLNFKRGYITTKEYPIIKNIRFAGKVSNGKEKNNTTSSATFQSFHLETERSSVDADFVVSNLDKPTYSLNTKLTITLEEFANFIPDTLVQSISGKVIAAFSTRGVLPDSMDDDFINLALNQSSAQVLFKDVNLRMDSMTMNDFSARIWYKPGIFKVNELMLALPDYHIDLKNTSLNAQLVGRPTDLSSLTMRLKSFRAESLQGKIWGSGSIKNFEHPEFVVDANALMHLAELMPFVPDSLVHHLSGDVKVSLNTYGTLNLDSIVEQANDIVFKQSRFEIDFKNVAMAMPDTLVQFSKLSGKVKMVPDTISVSNMKGEFAGVDVAMDSTLLVNVYNTVVNNLPEKLTVRSNLSLGALDYRILTPFIDFIALPDTSIASDVQEEEPQNYLMDVRGKLAVKSFKYDGAFIDTLSAVIPLSDSTLFMLKSYLGEQVFVEDISTKYRIEDSLAIIDRFKFKAFGGSSENSMSYKQNQDGSQIISMKNVVDRMDLRQLLADFNNFGQDTLITYENIKGLFSTTMNSRFVLKADTLVSEDMRIMGNYKMENGGIYNFQPAMAMSKFTGIKELDSIDFKTLDSKIFIFKNKIFMPETHIVSTAMDITAFGMESMGDDFEYHIQMHLGDVMSGKSKKVLERQAKTGDDVNKDDVDRNAVKLIYAEIDGKKKTGFDTKKAQTKMKVKIKTQLTILNLNFHPILVSFDTGIK